MFELAWTHSQVVLRQLNASEADAQLYGRLAGAVIYTQAGVRAETGVLARNRRGQSGLWGYGISGDLPIVLVRIGDAANIELVRQLVQAHAYWRLKGPGGRPGDLERGPLRLPPGAAGPDHGLIAAGVEAHVIDRPGGIFVRRGEQMSDEDRVLLQTVARVIFSDSRGTLAEQVNRRPPRERRRARRSARERRAARCAAPRRPRAGAARAPRRAHRRPDRSSTASAASPPTAANT